MTIKISHSYRTKGKIMLVFAFYLLVYICMILKNKNYFYQQSINILSTYTFLPFVLYRDDILKNKKNKNKKRAFALSLFNYLESFPSDSNFTDGIKPVGANHDGIFQS